MMAEFVLWAEKIGPEVDAVKELLSKELSDDPESLIHDLKIAEAHNARIGSMLAEAGSFLKRANLFHLPGRDGKTEMERKAMVESEVAPIQAVKDTLDKLSDAIKQRLILGESCLSYYRQTHDRTIQAERRVW